MQTNHRQWHNIAPEQHELHFNPQHAFPDYGESQKLRAPVNTHARETLRQTRDIPYGEHPLRKLDIYPAEGTGPTPVHVFFHGGYWRAQDKENFAWVAAPLVENGITTVVVNYELCPGSTLDGVVQSALAAFGWVARNIEDHGGDPTRICISGHSAGAHLVAAILAEDWAAKGIDPASIVGAIGVSGVFDPASAMLTTVNSDLHLTDEIASRHDYERKLPQVRCPISLFAGGREPWGWLDQTWRYAMHLRRHDIIPDLRILPQYDHFDILMDFMETDHTIGETMVSRSLGQ